MSTLSAITSKEIVFIEDKSDAVTHQIIDLTASENRTFIFNPQPLNINWIVVVGKRIYVDLLTPYIERLVDELTDGTDLLNHIQKLCVIDVNIFVIGEDGLFKQYLNADCVDHQIDGNADGVLVCEDKNLAGIVGRVIAKHPDQPLYDLFNQLDILGVFANQGNTTTLTRYSLED